MKSRVQGLLKNRKVLYLFIGIVIVSVFALSIAYAALSTVLEISGNAQVNSASWDIRLKNVNVKEGSVSANSPQISGSSTLSFDVDLDMPGDFYEFTVDVVNDGSIDAMIDSVVKTPELTSEQAKYIKYEVSYANGESINTKQTIKSKTKTPIKVRIEYRNDLSASDLPSSATELSLKLTLVYVQSDGSGSEIKDNGEASVVRVVSGDGTQVGNEVCIKEECFYVISSTSDTVTMLAKYNLHVGNSVDKVWKVTPLTNPTGIQDEDAIGYDWDDENNGSIFPIIGTTAFSSDSQNGTNSNDYSGSIVEGYVNSYNSYLVTQGVTPIESRLITKDELISLGCSVDDQIGSCSDAPSWVYATSYWSSAAYASAVVWCVESSNSFELNHYSNKSYSGVRPVIVISKNYL